MGWKWIPDETDGGRTELYSYPRKWMAVRQLQLADLVRLGGPDGEPDDKYLVMKMDDKELTLFGVYLTHANFAYAGGRTDTTMNVIPYIGTRTVTLSRDSDTKCFVLQRTQLR